MPAIVVMKMEAENVFVAKGLDHFLGRDTRDEREHVGVPDVDAGAEIRIVHCRAKREETLGRGASRQGSPVLALVPIPHVFGRDSNVEFFRIRKKPVEPEGFVLFDRPVIPRVDDADGDADQRTDFQAFNRHGKHLPIIGIVAIPMNRERGVGLNGGDADFLAELPDFFGVGTIVPSHHFVVIVEGIQQGDVHPVKALVFDPRNGFLLAHVAEGDFGHHGNFHSSSIASFLKRKSLRIWLKPAKTPSLWLSPIGVLSLSRKRGKTMITGFADCLIDVAGVGFKRTSLSINNGRISSIGTGKGIHLPDNLFLIPGLIDEHIHGSDGFDAMDGKVSSIQSIQRALPQDGVTSFCPTTMTMGKEAIISALSSIDEALKNDGGIGSRILGAHLEGPFISSVFKGAQEEKNIRLCDVDLMKEFVSVCPIKEVTFAYEEKGDDLLRYLKDKGILASIGHSNCEPELLKKGIEEGIRCSTHTFNAMRRFTHRDVGIVGIVLLDQRVRCELIGDLIHVCPDAIRLLYRMKGNEGIVLITDSMEAKHLPDGKYALGGQDVYAKDGAARLLDGTLAGSILALNHAVRNVKNTLGVSLAEAVDFATKNPAKNLHLEGEIGSIQAGYRADFAVVDQDLNVYLTVRDDQIIYQNPSSSWRF